MSIMDPLGNLRARVPLLTDERGVRPGYWLVIEGNRHVVTGVLLLFTFVSMIVIGVVWPIHIQSLLNETQTVQMVLNTYLSGMILLVSIVVSINSIVLSYEITDVSDQEERIEGALDFRQRLGEISEVDVNPTNPNAFLQVMAEALRERAEELVDVTEGGDEEFAQSVIDHIESIIEMASSLESSVNQSSETEFGGLWRGLDADYGPMVNQSRKLGSRQQSNLPEEAEEPYHELMQALEVFATGREYFKTLYYSREISELSRTLLFISLPSIIVTTSTILAIDADLVPEVWGLGLPPLLVFVALTFTIALGPFIVLTAYMLRLATVARRTAAAGPFVLS